MPWRVQPHHIFGILLVVEAHLCIDTVEKVITRNARWERKVSNDILANGNAHSDLTICCTTEKSMSDLGKMWDTKFGTGAGGPEPSSWLILHAKLKVNIVIVSA